MAAWPTHQICRSEKRASGWQVNWAIPWLIKPADPRAGRGSLLFWRDEQSVGMAYRELQSYLGGFSSRSSSLRGLRFTVAQWSKVVKIMHRIPAELVATAGQLLLVSCSGSSLEAASRDLAKDCKMRLELRSRSSHASAYQGLDSLSIPKEATVVSFAQSEHPSAGGPNRARQRPSTS